MKKLFSYFVASMFLMLVPLSAFASEDHMQLKTIKTDISHKGRYVEFDLSYYNAEGNDSYTTSPITITVNGTSWSVSNFTQSSSKQPDSKQSKDWKYDNTQNGMQLKAAYSYKDESTADHYAKFRVYFTKVYEGQKISVSYSATYYCQKDNKSWNSNESGSFTATVQCDQKFSEPIHTSDPLRFTSTNTIPASSSYTYDYYLLTKDSALSYMVSSTCADAIAHTVVSGAGKALTIDVTKTPALYFQMSYYPRYTVSYDNLTIYLKQETVLNTQYPLSGSGTKDEPFLISSAEDLDLFCQMVNESKHPEVCGKLMTDVDYSAYQGLKNMIGTSSYPYAGTFDGNGKSIKINFNTTTEQYAALFRYTKNATIGNLILKGNLTHSAKCTGALVGLAQGSLTLLNIVNTVDIQASIDGDNSGGAMICVCDNSSSVTIQNCGYYGNMSGTKAINNAGFVSWVRDKSSVTVLNSFFAPKTNTQSTTGSYTFVRFNSSYSCNISIQNCYYTTAFGTTQGTKIDHAALATGELAWKLNGKDGGDWLQDIGEDAYPTLWDAQRVYKDGANEDGTNYVNKVAELKGHGTASDPYLITCAQDLETFRDMVNDGYPTICARLTANVDMADRYWLPIGRYTQDGSYQVTYTGIFDGDGYTISNLSGSGSNNDHDMGLIGRAGDGCTVMDLVMHNVHVEAALYRAAPIVGLAEGEVKIISCGVNGVVRLSGKNNKSLIGGLVGNDYAGKVTVKMSYTVYSNLCSNTVSSSDSYCGNDVKNWAATGELCYRLNGNAGKDFHWRQNLETQSYPVLRDGKKVYKDGGTYYNQTLSGSDFSTFTDEMSTSDFKIIHHGGHLYEFIVLGGTNDGEGCHPFPSMVLEYKLSNDEDTWVQIAQLDSINREHLEFTEEWSGDLTVKQGKFIDARSWQEQPPVFWLYQGNHTAKKYASLLWMAPKELKSVPAAFRYKAINQSNPIAHGSVVDPAAPTDGQNSIIVMDPYIDAQSTNICSQAIIMTALQNIYSFALWDATDDKFISAQEFTEPQKSITGKLPAVEGYHTIVALMFGDHVETTMKGADSTYVTYGIPFRQKPTHTVQRFKKIQNYNHKNIIEWAIACPKDSDLMEGDQFAVYRAIKKDFSDAQNIGNLDVSAYVSTTIENDTTFGWFKLVDDATDAQANAERYTGTHSMFDDWNIPASAKSILTGYKYPERYIYYKVKRTSLGSMFGEKGTLFKTWSVLLNQVLPTIAHVKVEKTADWSKTHKVNLRVTLPNPYPWDLVDAADRDSVLNEAQNQGFESRMFVWDEKAKIQIQRYSFADEWYEGKDEAAKTIVVKGSDVKQDSVTGEYYAIVSDIQSMPFTHYYYKAIVDNSESNYPICDAKNVSVNTSKEDADACYDDKLIAISNFRASQGTVAGQVNLEWDADEGLESNIKIERREYARGYGEPRKEEDPQPDFTEIQRNGNSAIDNEALAAVVNQYRAIVKTTCRGKVYESVAGCLGWAPYYGSIQGRVKMPNGTAMPGDVDVTVKSMEDIVIRDIYNEDSTEVVMPGVTIPARSLTVKANESGIYKVEGLVYYGTGKQYEVQATSAMAEFVGPSGTSPNITLTLEDETFDYTDIDFTCNNVKQFSGRVLYANSTIPVREMYFKVNGTILRKADGKPVTTDAMGNFAFTVPTMELSIQAFKPGHRLSGDGYVLGGKNKDQKVFTPDQDYDGLTLTDSTSIRLVGRIVGGDIEGSKPVGFGVSNNNLGDSITIVLQLEGDNTSYTYFNRLNPEETHHSEVFAQPVEVNGQMDVRNLTRADFQSKRIVVKANNETGEFCVDLAPAKYKVSQIYANGYSNLYGEGEGLTVIDLTDSVFNKVYTYEYELTEDVSINLATAYCASFNRVYHAPVQLVMEQINGRVVDYFGEKEITVNTLTGHHAMQIAWYDDEEGETAYTFEYPVFQGGKYYQFRLKAYEDYHYNNSLFGRLTRVPVGGNEVTISNGFVKGGEPEYVDLEEEGLNKGTAYYGFLVDNATYNVGEEEALFNIRASVDVNGFSYHAVPVYGYATGQRDMGVEVRNALESKPEILDYIRDPYGADSYAYRESGTTYHWSYNYEKDYQEYFTFDLMLGLGFKMDFGFGASSGTIIEIPLFNFNLEYITKHNIETKDGEFEMTLSEQMSTSDDPNDVGAMADIYLGHVSTVDVRKYQCFNVLDSASYNYNKVAFESGAMTLVAEGETENGSKQYLVIADGYGSAPGQERMFAYTQKHIMGVLIPNLEAQRDAALRLAPTAIEAKDRANHTGMTFYYEQDGEYYPQYPDTMVIRKDTVQMCNNRIKEWQDVIAANEEIKYRAQMESEPSKKYSFAGTAIEYSEEASTYYRTTYAEGPKPVTWGISGGGSGGHEGDDYSSKDQTIDGNGDIKDKDGTEQDACGLSVLFDVNFGGGPSTEMSSEFENYECVNAGSGFYLHTNDNGYLDMDVYQVVDDSLLTVDPSLVEIINNYERGSSVEDYKLKTVNGDDINGINSGLTMNEYNAAVHNYIFVQRGGATRNPWTDADSTFFYKPDGERLPLCARTLKIDNPKIYVENPVINNQPADEKAVFTLRLSNETEINPNAQYLNASSVWLHVDEESNPDGAKLTIDGMPLRNAMEIYLEPGQTITKTLEVERGGKPYDYEDILLMLTDDPDYWTLEDDAYISVHYVPASSPVNLSQPADNWLMNTQSQVDEDGKYFIPVQIDGFSTAMYDNFDHIELQYKKQTESEDQWVNLCSYYADDSLYAMASGTKDMITVPGKIANIKFYGEKDPIEMKYDLRAVTFARLGNGYIKRYSKVVSGTKDTRNPEVFGKPKPSNGILTFEDVITLPFSEAIAYNYLDETVNFSVQGYTNSSDADNSSRLYFSGTDSQKAETKVSANFNQHDVTLEMMVKVDDASRKARFVYAIGDEEVGNIITDYTFNFGYDGPQDRLYATIGSVEYQSVKLATKDITLSSALTHVALVYSASDSTVRFYVGQAEVEKNAATANLKSICRINGRFGFGGNLKGSMTNMRSWSRVLSDYELGTKYQKIVSANENNLRCYWPVDETTGSVVVDKVSGANLYLTDVNRETPDGFSLRIENKPVKLTSDATLKCFTRDKTEDYSLSFWFRMDESSVDNTMVFASGSDDAEEVGMDKMRIGFVDGELILRTEGQDYSFGATKQTLTTSTWNHVALTVNHSQNIASLFVNGVMTNQISAEGVGGLASSYTGFGDANFKGNIDNITLWTVALPATYILKTYNTNYSGTEKELKANINFEQTLANSQGTLYTAFSPLNNVIVESTGKIAGDSMVVEAEVTPDQVLYAPVRTGARLQNLPFTWKSTDDELLININKADADINNQQIDLVVRNVEDLNGNVLQNAQMWSIYVNRNVLQWEADKLIVSLQYGNDTTVIVPWTNKSGRSISYTVENNANWLQVTNTKGTVEPLSTGAVALTISDGLAPGVYTTTVSLIDENNLISKLSVVVTVSAEAPEWEVTDDPAYNETMNVVGVVKKQTPSGSWYVDMHPNDLVAAFINKVCVGKAYITVDATNNTSVVFLTIRGNTNLNNIPVEFCLWSNTDGKVYAIDTDEPILYQNKSILGAQQPVEMRTSERKYQRIELKQGWNWVSLNVKLAVNLGANSLFTEQSALTAGDMLKRNGTNPALFTEGGVWDATLDAMPLLQSNVYQVYAQKAATVVASGTAFTDENRLITLDFGNSNWADLAYLLESAQPINTALNDFVAGGSKAPVGTIIKSHDEFAVARNDGHWFGSLQYLRPGVGYYVQRTVGMPDQITIRYYDSSTPVASAPVANEQTDCASIQTPTMMPVIATFAEGQYQDGDILVAMADGHVVGYAAAMTLPNANSPQRTTGADYRYFLSIHADQGSRLQFIQMRNGQAIAVSSKGFCYDANGVAGSIEHPYVVDFTAGDENYIYDMLGMKYDDREALKAGLGVFIVNGQKVLVR